MSWILYIVVAAATIIPVWKLCERDGLNPFWSLVCIVPLGLIVLLWILAFRRGPSEVA